MPDKQRSFRNRSSVYDMASIGMSLAVILLGIAALGGLVKARFIFTALFGLAGISIFLEGVFDYLSMPRGRRDSVRLLTGTAGALFMTAAAVLSAFCRF